MKLRQKVADRTGLVFKISAINAFLKKTPGVPRLSENEPTYKFLREKINFIESYSLFRFPNFPTVFFYYLQMCFFAQLGFVRRRQHSHLRYNKYQTYQYCRCLTKPSLAKKCVLR